MAHRRTARAPGREQRLIVRQLVTLRSRLALLRTRRPRDGWLTGLNAAGPAADTHYRWVTRV